MTARTRTAAQAEASRRNGRLSEGPVSPAGKLKVSANGVVHGLRAERVVLAHEDPALCLERVQTWVDALKPADDAELEVVVSVADIRWRLQRLDQVELNRVRAEALAEAEGLRELKFLALVERAAKATSAMVDALSIPRSGNDDEAFQALLCAARTVVEMVRAVEGERREVHLGAERLGEAASLAVVLSDREPDAEAFADLLAAARACADAVTAQLEPARGAASKATAALAATVPLPDSKQMALLARYRRDLERRLESELRVLAAVREHKVQVAGSSGLVGQPIPIRLVG